MEVTAINVAATYFGFRYIDKIGRRKMAIGGYIGMVLFAIVAAAGLAWLGGTARIVLVMLGLSLFIASFALGVGGTGGLIQGEVFPTAVRGRAGIGLDWVLVCFAGLSVMAIAFIAVFLPETKGLSVDDITTLFERPASEAGTGVARVLRHS